MFTSQEIKQYIQKYPTRSEERIDILVGPSWVGKTWVVEQLKSTHTFLITTTTRAQRQDEIPGIDANFVSQSQFEQYLKNHEMINGFILHDEYYGYRGSDVDRVIAEQKIPIAIVYYKVLDDFLQKFPSSRIAFMFPPDTIQAREFIFNRARVGEREIPKDRLLDFEEQMRLMYHSQPTLLEKYPKGKLFKIINNISALDVVEYF